MKIEDIQIGKVYWYNEPRYSEGIVVGIGPDYYVVDVQGTLERVTEARMLKGNSVYPELGSKARFVACEIKATAEIIAKGGGLVFTPVDWPWIDGTGRAIKAEYITEVFQPEPKYLCSTSGLPRYGKSWWSRLCGWLKGTK